VKPLGVGPIGGSLCLHGQKSIGKFDFLDLVAMLTADPLEFIPAFPSNQVFQDQFQQACLFWVFLDRLDQLFLQMDLPWCTDRQTGHDAKPLGLLLAFPILRHVHDE